MIQAKELFAKYKKLENMGYDTYTKCFETSILPVINYGSEVCGFIKNNKSDLVQTKAMKYFLGVHHFAANDAVEGDMGWHPNHITRTLNVLRYWNRLVLMNNNRLTKRIFNYYYELNEKGSWCHYVKTTLMSLDMGNIYDDQLECDLTLCKALLYERYTGVWLNNVNRKPKLRTYKEIKNSFEADVYVKLNLEKSQRSLLAQLRLGILPLHIKTGRFVNKKIEERICNFCNSENVEDEYHFLFHCDFYKQERN